MIIHSGKKVVCVQDIPSNIIEEAIFILKTGMTEPPTEKNEERNQAMILAEAEDIVEECIEKLSLEEKQFHKEREYQKNDWIGEIIYVISLLFILAICMGVVMGK